MTTYQPLTPEEVRATAQAYYDQRQAKASAVDRPTMILVGGQPGAGKTAAAKVARAELRQAGGFIHLDADRMRERIDLRGASPTSDETQATAGALVVALRAIAIDGRRNLLEEGTFRNAASLERLVQRVQAVGYRVELVAVATPFEESRLGIYQRFEAQHVQQSLNPRFVSESYHDEAAGGFADTIAKLADQFDRVRVISRAGRVHFDSLYPGPQAPALEALKAGQAIDASRLDQVIASWQIVRELAQARSAPADYVQGLDRHLQVAADARAALDQQPDAADQAARRAFEMAMEAKRVPEATRQQLRERFDAELLHRRSLGQGVGVRVFDPSAARPTGPSGDPSLQSVQTIMKIEPRGPKR